MSAVIIRWHDGTLADPHQQAARLQAEAEGRWCVWWGPRCGEFFAVPRQDVMLLLEARTPGELSRAMAWSNRTPNPNLSQTRRGRRRLRGRG